jgi:hypothetical protein
MSQQLPLVQIPMPQQQQPIIGVDMTQQDYNNLQQQGLLPSQLQQPQIVDVAPQSQPQPVVGNAGAQRTGIDWAGALSTLGSYLSAAGQGIDPSATTLGGGLSGMGDTVAKHQQNIKQFQTMAPYYQQMGYDVSKLDPRRGGAGVATTPEKMVDLQSKIAEKDYLNDYRQTLAQARAAQAAQTAGTKGVTIGTLRMMSPQFKKMIDAQYGFGNGQNLKLLDQVVPASLVQGYMPAVTKTNNMVYSGGLHSSQNKTGRADIYQHGGSGGGSKKSGGSKKLIF